LLDEIPFQSTRNGTRYRVLERRYAIFPERSGELEIPPLTLSGRLIERPADRLWQPSVRGRRVRIESDPVTLAVLPRPAGYIGEHWLPARRITLSQQISDADTLQVGEPVTRTVILDAVGLEENMIEEPGWPPLEHARIYPDQPQGISRDDGQWVLGHKEFRYAVVPETAGELVLPEIRLEWWDTTSDQPRTAILPEHRVQVLASELPTDVVGISAVPALSPVAVTDPSVLSTMQRWRLLALVFAVLWLLTLGLYARHTTAVRHARNVEPALPADEQSLLTGIKKACRQNNAREVRNLLARWLRRYGPGQAHGSLMEFANNLEDRTLRDAIYRFDASEFSSLDPPGWNGSEFWSAFSAWQQSGRKQPRKLRGEPDLYARE
jgi:hypothetical protein